MSSAIYPLLAGGKAVQSMVSDEPVAPEPEVAPTPDDLSRRTAAERKMQRKYAGSGRAGTMLTGSDKLG